MSQMPGTISKGTIFEQLDRVLSDASRHEELLAALDGPTPLSRLGVDFGVLTEDEAAHVQTDWFGSVWWPKVEGGGWAVEQIVRAGVKMAVEEAKRTGLPVDSYWICHPGPHEVLPSGVPVPAPKTGEEEEKEHVEATCFWSGKQITLVFHTPEPPPLPHTSREPIKQIAFEKDGFFWETDFTTVPATRRRLPLGQPPS